MRHSLVRQVEIKLEDIPDEDADAPVVRQAQPDGGDPAAATATVMTAKQVEGGKCNSVVKSPSLTPAPSPSVTTVATGEVRPPFAPFDPLLP